MTGSKDGCQFLVKLAAALLFLCALGGTAEAAGRQPIGFTGKGGGKEVVVRIAEYAFAPETLVIEPGTTVTWQNEDGPPHTVTEGEPGNDPDARLFDSSREATGELEFLMSGDSWSFTFTEPGEYAYYCLPHAYMKGNVVVRSGTAARPET